MSLQTIEAEALPVVSAKAPALIAAAAASLVMRIMRSLLVRMSGVQRLHSTRVPIVPGVPSRSFVTDRSDATFLVAVRGFYAGAERRDLGAVGCEDETRFLSLRGDTQIVAVFVVRVRFDGDIGVGLL